MLEIFDRNPTATYIRQILEGVYDPPIDPPPQLLNPREAAKLLNVCEKTLWSLANHGEIPVVRIGRSVRYDPRDLARWIAANKSVGGNCSTGD